jgi:hypothetical protein
MLQHQVSQTASPPAPRAPGILPRLAAGILLAVALTGAAAGDEGAGDSAAQANNPLANMTALNFQDYYIGRITDTDKDRNQFWVRFAKPFAVAHTNWLMRASLPVNSFPVATNSDLATRHRRPERLRRLPVRHRQPGRELRSRPPDHRADRPGRPARFGEVVRRLRQRALRRALEAIPVRFLLTWQARFAGSDSSADVNTGAFQPFVFYQLGKGTYLRSAPIWVYNFENDAYSIPLGLGIGQVIKRGKTVFNVFVEPQASVAYRGPGQPDWQIFAGFNM